MNNLNPHLLSDALWEIYKTSENIDEAFSETIKALVENTSAEFGLVYLQDSSILIDIEEGEKKYKETPSFLVEELDEEILLPVYTTEFILSYQFYLQDEQHPILRLPKARLNLKDKVKIGKSVYFKEISSLKFGLTDHNSNEYDLFLFDSPKIMLCRAMFILSFKKNFVLSDDYKKIIAKFLDDSVPIAESIYRRQIVRLTRAISSSNKELYTLHPGECFQNSFKNICEQLQLEGASLIVRGLPSSETPLQLVSAFPKQIPKDRNIYNSNSYSTTQWIFRHGKSCMIPSIFLLREKLSINSKQKIEKKPVWCDSEDITRDRTILYNFSKREEGVQYLLRCTNSKKNPHKLFNVFDEKIGQELVLSFGLMHKAIENEQRAMKIFFDVKHELSQKLVGINSATNYVKKTINTEVEDTKKERILKLKHIKDTTNEIVKMLGRFNFPMPTIDKQYEDEEIIAIRLYADLIKPICETFSERAQKKNTRFEYYKMDQLGLIYSDLSKWRQIIENLVNNMVKYTYPNEKMGVAFERISDSEGGGGQIHFASRSIPISPDEVSLLFEFKYRSQAAIDSAENGEGLGLSIVKYMIGQYGGQILFKNSGQINVFTLKLPKHLFRPHSSSIRKSLRQENNENTFN